MISITILTKNCARSLRATLESVRTFPEVVLFDTGSTDETLLIARKYPNVVIHQGNFEGFGKTHNQASALAVNDWILSLDSDEVLTPELLQELSSLSLDSSCVYSLSRDNYFQGKQIRCCSGWFPDRVIRLYHRQKTRFSEDSVHEKILTEGVTAIFLSSPLIHVPYREISDFLAKMQTYSDLFAEQYEGKRKGSLSKAILHGWFAFFKSYVLKKGFLGGREGFIISAYNGHTAYYKYLKLLEKTDIDTASKTG